MDKAKTETPKSEVLGKNLETEFVAGEKSPKKWFIIGGAVLIAILLGVLIANTFLKPKEPVFSMLDIYLENMAEEKLGEEIDKKKYEGINKYNHMGYKNVSGITVKEQADKEGMPFEDYKKTYGLPKDMPEDTYFDAAFNMMPIKVRLVIDEGETDFVTFKKNFKVPDYIEIKTKSKGIFSKKEPLTLEVTEELPWGVVYDELTLEVVVGKEKFDEFKKEYNLDDKVTLSTKYKEVRPIIEEEKIKDRDNMPEEVPAEDSEIVTDPEGEPATEVVEEVVVAEAVEGGVE